MKKDKEKDKDKKDKGDKEKKKKEKDEKQDKKRDKKERQNMTPEEISRLEEMKKGVMRKFSDRKKTPGGAGSFHDRDHRSPSDEGSSGSVDSMAASHTMPSVLLTKPKPLPRQTVASANKMASPPATKPKPQKVKSILKSQAAEPLRKSIDLDDSELLVQNTRRNEDLFTASGKSSPASPSKHWLGSPSYEASSTSTTPSTSALDFSERIEEEEEEESKSEPGYISKLKLPPIVPTKPPRIREIVVQRNQSGGFGFSLRKGLIPFRGGGLPQVVTFAEPASGPTSRQTGLLPGDRLLEVSHKIKKI